MYDFDILQPLVIKLLKISQVSTALCHFPVVIMIFLKSYKFVSWLMQISFYL